MWARLDKAVSPPPRICASLPSDIYNWLIAADAPESAFIATELVFLHSQWDYSNPNTVRQEIEEMGLSGTMALDLEVLIMRHFIRHQDPHPSTPSAMIRDGEVVELPEQNEDTGAVDVDEQ